MDIQSKKQSYWIEVNTNSSHSPSSRVCDGITLKESRNVILFGGWDFDNPFKDTWVFDQRKKNEWKGNPSHLLFVNMTYDHAMASIGKQ